MPLTRVFQTDKPMYIAVLGVGLIAGVFLRVYQAGAQIITGDEWHALHMAMTASYGEIASTFGDADHSIPIALYYKLLADNAGLSQWLIQAPFILAGCLLVVCVPLLLRRQLGDTVAGVLAVLLAVSPILITQARFARPYPIALLLSLLAVIYFFRWWQNQRPTDAAIYVICTALTGYFLILNLPFVLAPFLYFFPILLYEGKNSGNWQNAIARIKSLFVLGVVTCLPLAMLVLPPLINDFSALSEKSGTGMLSASDYLRLVPVFSGNAGPVPMLLSVLLAILGCAAAYTRKLAFVGYLAILTLLQSLAVGIANPAGTENIVVLARYLILALPLYFVLVALGVEKSAQLLSSRFTEGWTYGLAGAFILTSFLLGPIPRAYYFPNNNIVLMTISEIVLGDQLYASMLSGDAPRFYTELRSAPADEYLIVQAPYYYNFDYLPLYQHMSRQRIAMGITDELCSTDRSGEVPVSLRDRINLNNYYYLNDPEQLRDSGVNYVVFHKNLEAELSIPVIIEEIDVSACIEAYDEWFGPPIYQDNKVTAFAINRMNN